jgi:predicted permease
MNPGRQTRWDRWIGLLLLFYPRRFRERFGADLSAHCEAPRTGLLLAAIAAAWDLSRGGLGARLDDFRTRHGARSHLGGVDGLVLDVRHTLRGVVHRPLFAFGVISTLALAGGLNAAVFAIVDRTLLRPLPFEDDARIVSIGGRWVGYDHAAVSIPEFADFRDRSRTLASLAAYVGTSINLADDVSGPEWLLGARVTPSFFDVMGVPARLGRVFSREEEQPSAPPVVVLSHGLWMRRFGGDPGALGKMLRFDSGLREIVGVMPASFRFPDADTELWIPLAINRASPPPRGNRNRQVVGRIAAGESIDNVRREMSVIAGQFQQEHPQQYAAGSGWGLSVRTLREHLFGDFRRPLTLLMIAVSFVLLIACANVANLLVARASDRDEDLATRAALGAPPARLIRQGLVEGVLLGCGGGVAGLALGGSLVRLLQTDLPHGLPTPERLFADPRVAAFTVTITSCTAVIAALTTTVRAVNAAPGRVIGANRRSTDVSTRRLRGGLTITQIALAAMLLVVGGVAFRSFARLVRVDAGILVEDVTTARVTALTRYASLDELASFLSRITAALSESPEVEHAGMVSILPLSGATTDWGFIVDGRASRSTSLFENEQTRTVGGDYFQALAIPLMAGRFFDSHDTPRAPAVAIVSRLTANRYWASDTPIGKRIRFGGSTENGPWTTIVGVVGDVRDGGLGSEFVPILYVPATQLPTRTMTVVARVKPGLRRGPGVIAEAIRSVDPQQPVFELRTMHEWAARSIARPRFSVLLLGLFAGLAVLLAAIGIYAVMAFTVARRTRELGIRLALGARPSSLLGMVLRRSVALAGVGLVVGLVAGLTAATALEQTFVGVRSLDPVVLAGVAILVIGVALVAAYLPAQRAMRVDPVEALRME